MFPIISERGFDEQEYKKASFKKYFEIQVREIR